MATNLDFIKFWGGAQIENISHILFVQQKKKKNRRGARRQRVR
jgi:hypothetical protein